MTAVQDWMRDQAHDPAFYKTSAVVGLATVLEERQDIIYALRIAQSRGTTVSEFPIEIGIVAEVLGSGVECLPVIGNALSLVEAYEGRDLFCRKLSPFDRALLVAMVLIPAGSRLVKGGRALHRGPSRIHVRPRRMVEAPRIRRTYRTK